MAKRGRPAFNVTQAMRRQVQELTACGMPREDIARAVGCHVDTLDKHFGDDLRTGRAKKRAEVVRLLFKTARAGNVSAQRKLEEMTAVSDVPDAWKPADPKPAAVGKKEQAAADAVGADHGTPFEGLVKH